MEESEKIQIAEQFPYLFVKRNAAEKLDVFAIFYTKKMIPYRGGVWIFLWQVDRWVHYKCLMSWESIKDVIEESDPFQEQKVSYPLLLEAAKDQMDIWPGLKDIGCGFDFNNELEGL